MIMIFRIAIAVFVLMYVTAIIMWIKERRNF
nr:MAG TPA: hypothetical protein [Caudoviricetes sp.]